MPRPPRHNVAGCIYHVTTRGNDGRAIYGGARERGIFLTHLGDVVERYAWECLGFCLMSTHYHALIRLAEPNLPHGMAMLNGGWAKRFNFRHGCEGHLFERRYHSELVATEGHLFECARYLPLNPVVSGLCKHPRQWRWSSYRALAGEGAAARLPGR